MAGRPQEYKTSKELSEKVDKYFSTLPKKTRTLPNGTEVKVKIPTITGLALYLGFASRQSFYDYENRDGFSYTIKKARAFIEREYEEQLQFGNTTGAIFALKNMGWKDKTEVEQTINDKTQSPEERGAEIDKLLKERNKK